MRSILILLVAASLASLSTAFIRLALRGEDVGRLVVDGAVKDLGRLRQGQTSRAEFLLTNDTRDRIQILEISPSCTCTVISQG